MSKDVYLKSLELNGFKSFAQKSVLEFPKGITAIVGPNGSGKSNVIDAIKWILGEREAKNLRGAKAEDLIFAGTSQKPRMGIASVAIYFDNDSGFFPIDFGEISITRQIDREGNSKYTLNKTEVRAKEIIDFFARARLGTRGLTIINQGSSDLFVRATAEERRQMIEEILGLKEYQLKKAEANRKLKNTLQNLDKVKAMIEEVLPRLKTLKRQVAKWEKREEKEKELKRLENNYFYQKIRELQEGKIKIIQEISALDSQIKEKNQELKELSRKLKELETASFDSEPLRKLKARQQTLISKKLELQKNLGRIEAQIEFLSAAENSRETSSKDLITFITLIKDELEEVINFRNLEMVIGRLKNLILKIGDFFNQAKKEGQTAEKVKQEKEDLIVQMANLEDEIRQLKESEKGLEKNREDFNLTFKKAYELFESKREEIRELENRRNHFVFEKEKGELRLADLQDEWVKIGRSLQEFNNLNLGVPEVDSEKMISSDDDVERQMFRLRADLASIGEIDEALISEAKEVENHYNFLATQSEDLSEAAEDLENLIKKLTNEISLRFNSSLKAINDEFNKFFRLMFGGGSAKLRLEKNDKEFKAKDEKDFLAQHEEAIKEEEENERPAGIEIELNVPRKKIKSLDALSGGEKSLVSIAALFALISVSPPPFLVLDEVDAALDENNSKRFAEMVKEFSKKAQFIIVTHNRSVMEASDVLYGVTMNEDGTSRLLSLKLES